MQTAAALFYENGIPGTSVDRVVEAAGLTKPTLYQYFRSKGDLVAAVIAYRNDNWRQALLGRVEASKSPRRRLLAVFRFLEDFVTSETFRGCAIVNAVVELPRREAPGRDLARDNKRWNRELLERLCREAELTDPKAVAGALSLLFEGAIVTAYVAEAREGGR